MEKHEKATETSFLCLPVTSASPSVLNRTFFPERVFINDLDSYHGKALTRILGDKFFSDGGIVEEIGEGGEELGEELPGEEPVKEVKPFVEKIKYQIVGTSHDPIYQPTEDVSYIIKDDESIEEEILKCGTIVWDISLDPKQIPKAYAILKLIDAYLEKIKEDTPKKYENFEEQRVFILVSTVMTWANTKPVDPEDPDVPFVETDFKKRRPHPNYKDHIDLEKEVLLFAKKHKKLFTTFVIASGITYGLEEHDLHLLFKDAWYNKPDLPIINNGKNTVPLIHVYDLSGAIVALIQARPKKSKYILAVEQTPSTQKKIVMSVAKAMSNGKVKLINKADAFLTPEMTQNYFDRMTVNLKMEPNYIVNDLGVAFQSDLNFCENVTNMVKEFKEARKLQPKRIFLHGPPAVGKTSIAKELCGYYDLHYISVKSLIDETVAGLNADLVNAREQQRLKEAQEEEEGEEEEEEEDEEDLEAVVQELTDKLKEIQGMLDENENGRLSDEHVIEFMKKKLASNPCQNQGYVLDGYPKTSQQTKQLFGFAEDEADEGEEEEEEGGEEEGEARTVITPQYVIGLEASDDFLCLRIMRKPEREVQGTHYVEERMVERLTEFRKNNTEDNTLLNLFDYKEIHPILIQAETDIQENIIDIIKEKIGEKVGYPPTAEEIEEMRRKEEEERLERERVEEENRRVLEEEMLEERQKLMEAWIDVTYTLQEQQEQLLIAQNTPLREYLMKFVFPTLTKGLLEVSRIKPDDPIDFLAEYLFNQNPEGRMFDPAYVKKGEDLINAIREYQHKVSKFLKVDPPDHIC